MAKKLLGRATFSFCPPPPLRVPMFQSKNALPAYKPDLNSLKNKIVVSKLNDDVRTLLSSSNADNDINQTCDNTRRAISSATTTNVLPRTRKECDNIWKNDEELNTYSEQINYWKSVTGTTASDTQKGQIWKLRKKIKKRKHQLMNQFYRSEANKINLNAINRELKELFENTRKHQTLPSSQTSTYCKPEHLAAFFQNLFDQKLKNRLQHLHE